jgi:hypothetical protein
MIVSLLTLVELSIVKGRDNRGPRLVEELLFVLDASVVEGRLVEERRVGGMVGSLSTDQSKGKVICMLPVLV